jgi:hypothetical protein
MAGCIRGCTINRQHLADCEGDPCRGCVPRLAEHGLLCWPDHRHLERMLKEAPTVYDWLGTHLPAGSGSALREWKQHHKIDGSPPPLNVHIFDVRQRMADEYAAWVDLVCEQRGTRGPDRHSVKADAAYLGSWLYRIEDDEWIGDMWTELADTMRDAHALAPWRPEAKRIKGIPCPRCETCSLILFGGETDVQCLGCGEVLPPERYEIWTKIAAEEWGSVA